MKLLGSEPTVSPTDDATPLISQLAPERTFLVGGLSKAVAAGARGGWVSCPHSYRHRVRVAHKMMTGGLPFLLAVKPLQRTEMSAIYSSFRDVSGMVTPGVACSKADAKLCIVV